MITLSARSGSRLVSQIPHCCVNFRSRFSIRNANINDNGSTMSSSIHSPSATLPKKIRYYTISQMRETRRTLTTHPIAFHPPPALYTEHKERCTGLSALERVQALTVRCGWVREGVHRGLRSSHLLRRSWRSRCPLPIKSHDQPTQIFPTRKVPYLINDLNPTGLVPAPIDIPLLPPLPQKLLQHLLRRHP